MLRIAVLNYVEYNKQVQLSCAKTLADHTHNTKIATPVAAGSRISVSDLMSNATPDGGEERKADEPGGSDADTDTRVVKAVVDWIAQVCRKSCAGELCHLTAVVFASC